VAARIGTAAIALPLLLSGCETHVAPDPRLALACQTTACECVAAGQRIGRKPATAEMLWRPNGDAYCPPDFVLQIKPPAQP
jgi:hypothetical protein